MKRKLLSIVLALCLTLTLLPTMSVAAGSYADTNGHWAETAIERWSSYGILQGSEGKFAPDGTLTRAQMATILSRLLNLPAAESVGFTDVPAGEWYADAINRCAAAGILQGTDGKANPNAPITREQAMVMLCRALGIEALSGADLSGYPDGAQVSPYAQGYVAALVRTGIVKGDVNGKLNPAGVITRAEIVTIVDRMVTVYANADGATVSAANGGTVLVVAKNVKVENAPEGTKIIAGKDASGLSVNGKAVSAGQTYIVPAAAETKPSTSGNVIEVPPHAHVYTYVDNGNGTHTATCYAGDVTFTEQHSIAGNQCTLCGAAQTADSAASVKKSNGTYAYYPTLAKAINAADAGDTVTLVNDAGTNSLKAGITYDLNGYKLTYTSSGSFSFSNQTTSFIGGAKGGTLEFPNIRSTNSAIWPNAGATLNVSDITVTCNGSAFYPAGNATALNITNCNVSSSVYCVGTNASSTDNYGVIITLKDSKFTSTASDGDSTAVIVNVACELVIDNCELTAGRQGLIVRAGTATVTNSTIKTTGTYGEKEKYYAAPWSSGNEVPAAALTVGNYAVGAANAYLANAIVTLENTKLIGENNFPALYVDGNTSYIGKVSISGDAAFVSGAMMKGQQTAEGKATISLTGGTFSSDPTAYVAAGYITLVNGDGTFTVSNATEIPVTKATVQDYLDGKYGSINGKTLVLGGDNYDKIEFGRATAYAGSNTEYYLSGTKSTPDAIKQDIDNHPYGGAGAREYVRSMSNVTLKAADGATVTINGLVAFGGQVNSTKWYSRDFVADRDMSATENNNICYWIGQNWSNITFEGLTFTDGVNIEAYGNKDTLIDNVKFDNCKFNIANNADATYCIRLNVDGDIAKANNLIVAECVFTNGLTAVLTDGMPNVTVTGSTFSGLVRHAINPMMNYLPNAPGYGRITVTGNTFKNMSTNADKGTILRMGDVGAGAVFTIQNNTATEGITLANSIKVNSLADGITYNISGNNWGSLTASDPKLNG